MREPLLCEWLKKAIVCRVIASLGERKGRHNIGSCFIRQGSGLTTGGFVVWSAWAAAQTDFLHLKFVVYASRLACWLGKPVDERHESPKRWHQVR